MRFVLVLLLVLVGFGTFRGRGRARDPLSASDCSSAYVGLEISPPAPWSRTHWPCKIVRPENTSADEKKSESDRGASVSRDRMRWQPYDRRYHGTRACPFSEKQIRTSQSSPPERRAVGPSISSNRQFCARTGPDCPARGPRAHGSRPRTN